MPPRKTPAAPAVAAITPLLDEQVKDRVVYKIIAQFSTPKGIAVCVLKELWQRPQDPKADLVRATAGLARGRGPPAHGIMGQVTILVGPRVVAAEGEGGYAGELCLPGRLMAHLTQGSLCLGIGATLREDTPILSPDARPHRPRCTWLGFNPSS